ncbi:MAG: sigma 54-interacting transcriptional regulator [Planctomycetia bacterium]|nr:sigma 54-interacting transcriptional regulator [Planctomycetia bacterium]
MNRTSKVALWLLAGTVLAYCVGVLYRVRTTWDLGVYCLFATEGDGSLSPIGPTIGWVTGDIVGPHVPQPGDRLITVAGAPVPTVMDFEQRTGEISRSGVATRPLEVADVAGLWRLPPTENLASVDGERWTRVEFWRPGGDRTLATWLRLRPTPTATILMSLAWFVLEMAILVIGVLVVLRRPGDFSALMFFALCLVNVVTFMGVFHWVALIGLPLLVYPLVFCGPLLAPMTLHFYMLVPRPLGLVRRFAWATLPAIYLLPAVWIVMMFVCLGRINALVDRPEATTELVTALGSLTWLIYRSLAISAVMLLVGQGVLLYGFFRCRTTAERQQAAWLLGAAIVATGPALYLMHSAATDRAEFAYGAWPRAMVYVTSLVFTVAYAISITRYKLMQVGRIVNRGILYVGISFAATALFCLMVGLTTALVGTYYFRWENALAAGLTAMLVVILLGWVRDRFQKALDRRFYREKYGLDKAMRRLSEAVDQLVEPAQFARQLLSSAIGTVGAARGAVYLRSAAGDRYELACRANWPGAVEHMDVTNVVVANLRDATASSRFSRPGGGAAAVPRGLRSFGAELCCPLELESRMLGLLVLGRKHDGGGYTAEDHNFLQALARTTALALQSAQGHRTIDALKGELQAKVGKIAEQQRRITMLQAELRHRDSETAAAPAENATPAACEATLRHEIRGTSLAVKRMLAEVAKVAGTPSSVLVRGESGTGKELLARAVHFNSPRRDGPFVQVHCAALSQGLLESELFGHMKGAFTGADRDKVGRFELAHGGTLFLDEIGDVNLETQTKLLRVLQERAFERVGGVKTIEVDVRLVTATHRNLEELIRQGRFREDLYYRLNVISLSCPPLRQRRDDICELALHFLRVYAPRAGKSISGIDDEALEALLAYDWPGNIRQLENAIERAVVLADGDSVGRDDLPPEVASAALRASVPAAMPRERAPALVPFVAPAAGLDAELTELERGRVVEALQRAGGNKSEAARLLGMPRSTLLSKLRRLRLA